MLWVKKLKVVNVVEIKPTDWVCLAVLRISIKAKFCTKGHTNYRGWKYKKKLTQSTTTKLVSIKAISRKRVIHSTHCCAINKYFNLPGQLLAPWPVKEVAASMPRLFCRGGLSRCCMTSEGGGRWSIGVWWMIGEKMKINIFFSEPNPRASYVMHT